MPSNVFPEKFKGLWIPTEFLQLNGPGLLDKAIMSRVLSFQRDGTYMSNATFAFLFGVPRRTIENRIAYLLSEGWLINRGHGRGHRLLFVNMDMVRQRLTT